MDIIQPERIRVLNKKPVKAGGSYVLYWMQQSQRTRDNHALEYAVQTANRQRKPLLAVFGLSTDYPEANQRHFAFMLEGLTVVARELSQRRIPLQIETGSPPEVALQAAHKASVVVCDRGYLRHQRKWRRELSRSAQCPVVEVESDLIIPVQSVTDKPEFAARTIRPKINRLIPAFLQPLPRIELKLGRMDLSAVPDFSQLHSETRDTTGVSVADAFFKGGATEAYTRFQTFIDQALDGYAQRRNHPEEDASSAMSPYLHFGQVSALQLALKVNRTNASPESKAAYLEELIVRRELAANYVYYNPRYDNYLGLPDWARATLEQHRTDARRPQYDIQALENSQTSDPYWNAAMIEMKHTGYMHNYMRMYWGKKILEWLPDPRMAFEACLRLNNKYFIDGRDPNSYAGVGWIFGLHDRPWKERAIFGKIRYMAISGLERKFNIAAYVEKVKRKTKAARSALQER